MPPVPRPFPPNLNLGPGRPPNQHWAYDFRVLNYKLFINFIVRRVTRFLFSNKRYPTPKKIKGEI